MNISKITGVCMSITLKRFAKMITQFDYGIFILLLQCTIFVEVCPPSASPKPTSPPVSNGPSMAPPAATDSPKTAIPSVINNKGMLLIPTKGKT
jgi:hypothetical protein